MTITDERLGTATRVDAHVEGEQVRTLYRQSALVFFANVANAVILSIVLWNAAPPSLLVGWTSAMCLMVAVRISVRRAYWEAPQPVTESARWARAAVLGSLASGLLWGTAGALFLTRGSFVGQLVVVFVIGGMGAAAAGTLSCYLPAFYAYFVPSMAPLVLGLLLVGDSAHRGMALMMVLYVLLMLGVARNVNRAMAEAFRLRFDNELLVRELGGAKERLLLSNADLEERVAERTKQIEQHAEDRARLESDLESARRLEAVGRLAGGVAHDFNNLLTVTLANLSTALSDPAIASREALEEARQASVRASNLTRQLLAFGRKQPLHASVIDLHDVLVGLRRTLQQLVGERVELRSALANGVAAVKTDPSHMEQVIVNLVTNARDALPEGGAITLETELESKGGVESVVLRVSDTGAGVDEATRPHIFEPFFTTKNGSTGLGLATVHGIVEQNGGTVTLEHAPSGGACFEIRLPRSSEAITAKGQLGLGAVVTERPAAAGSGETILLVEDEPLVLRANARILTAAGYRVLTAVDGESALSLAASHEGPIHLLFTDVVMPKMTGPELAERLVGARPGLSVVMASGYAGDVVLPPSDALGKVRFLQKPFEKGQLLAQIRAALAVTRSVDAETR